MAVWCVFPSARPATEVRSVIEKWTAMGYMVAIQRDPGAAVGLEQWTVMEEPYRGYPAAMNRLIRYSLTHDPTCDWVVCAADDIWPDTAKTPDIISAECKEHFTCAKDLPGTCRKCGTFSVMQATSDRWGEDPRHHNPAMRSAYIDRVAGSPWIGREFAERVYGGNGPWCEEYHHMFADNELREVAVKLGVYWERPDLCHYHNHWGRPRPGERMAPNSRMPDFLREANSPEHWRKYEMLFKMRQKAGFPGSEVRA